MKLKALREHYTRVGNSWVPKRGFDSEEEARKERFLPRKWHAYCCSICGKYHIANKFKKDKLDDVA